MYLMIQQRSFVLCYRPRIHVRDGLQHVQLLRRRDYLHEETLRARDGKRRVPVQAHRTAVQLCPTPRARLWFQRQHVPQLVFGQVSNTRVTLADWLGAVYDLHTATHVNARIIDVSILRFPGVPACQTWTSSSARAGTTIRAPATTLVVRTRGACPPVRCACPC